MTLRDAISRAMPDDVDIVVDAAKQAVKEVLG